MRVGILGCGNMGKAIIRSLLNKYNDISIIAYDKAESALSNLPDDVLVIPPEEWGIEENKPDIVLIAVKPQDIFDALKPFNEMQEISDAFLFISIAAGVSIAKLEKMLPDNSRICRVMTNTPALIGEALSAYCCNTKCRASDKKNIEYILSAFGKIINVPERLINAITGLSGSGPAYVFLFLEALIEGGVSAGLPYAVSKECAVQTVIGSAKMILELNETPASLKNIIMSPGGTTVRGLMALEENKFKYAVIKAVLEASNRAEEISKQE